jgi:hypothetical protein
MLRHTCGTCTGDAFMAKHALAREMLTSYPFVDHVIRERQHVLGLDWPGLPEFHHPARHILM